MSRLVDVKTAVIVPNWNGADSLADCLDSLQKQSLKTHIIVVDNGSADGSLSLITQQYPDIELVKHSRNLGFSGGINAGFRLAMQQGFDYVASFNNDAVADEKWLEKLVGHLEKNETDGIATCKFLDIDGTHLDSTGDYYTNWGLPYPRGRGETDLKAYDGETEIFAASGGASLYRVEMLQEIGLFDEKFFAYYEDVDLSFRAQLAGWKISYVPAAVAYHKIGATSSKIKGFTTYHTIKNLPMLLTKNMPLRYALAMRVRLNFVLGLFILRAISRGHVWSVIKGVFMAVWLLPYSMRQRRRIQHAKTVSDEYIWNLIVHDLPPNAHALRRLRSLWWKIINKPRLV
jgi:GT2 family glycosyltransferase